VTPSRRCRGPTQRAIGYSSGLLRRRRRAGRVVNLRLGAAALRVWDDPAIFAREYDVSTWPPTELSNRRSGGVQPRSRRRCSRPRRATLGAAWWMDTDGIGPTGAAYSSIDDTLAVAPQSWLLQNGPMVGQARGARRRQKASQSCSGRRGTMALEVFASDGTLSAQRTLDDIAGAQSLGRTKSNTFLIAAPQQCGDGGCRPDQSRFVSARRQHLEKSGVISRAGLERYDQRRGPDLRRRPASLLTLVGVRRGRVPRSTAQPIDDDGAAAAPAEVWFTSTPGDTPEPWPGKRLRRADRRRLSAQSRGARRRRLPQPTRCYYSASSSRPRRLRCCRSISAAAGVLATAQLDQPRTLILGYSMLAPPSGGGAAGTLARYVCSEDR